MPCAFIDDGYCRTDLIPETKRHPAVSITYRPMLRGERNSHILRNGKLIDQGGDKVDEASRKTSEALAARITAWDITNSKGEPVAINAANLGKLEPNLFETIFRAVLGYDDDKDVNASAAEAEAEKN